MSSPSSKYCDTSHPQMLKVVYNGCYGGFDLSNQGLAEYNRRSSKSITLPSCIDREDPFLIEMVETMDPKEINSAYSKLMVKEFDKKFKSFLEWREYDGAEIVEIDYEGYVVENVKLIIRSKDISADEKVERITNIYDDIIDKSLGIKSKSG